MEKEKIEQAAMDYVEQYCPDCHPLKKHDISLFIQGARWRINEAWHDEKEIPAKEELVLCEICCNGEKAYLPLQWKADGKMTVDIPFLTDCKVTRWAYLADLLPDTRKEAEP